MYEAITIGAGQYRDYEIKVFFEQLELLGLKLNLVWARLGYVWEAGSKNVSRITCKQK